MDNDMQNSNLKNQLKLAKYLLFTLVSLQIILLGATIVVTKNRAYQTDPNQNSPFIPLWVAIFIPFISIIRKPHTDKGKRIWLWLLVGLATLVLFGMLVVLLKALG